MNTSFEYLIEQYIEKKKDFKNIESVYNKINKYYMKIIFVFTFNIKIEY